MYQDDEVKALRDEVQRLKDDLAKMKRAYEDALQNIDGENFASPPYVVVDGTTYEVQWY